MWYNPGQQNDKGEVMNRAAIAIRKALFWARYRRCRRQWRKAGRPMHLKVEAVSPGLMCIKYTIGPLKGGSALVRTTPVDMVRLLYA